MTTVDEIRARRAMAWPGEWHVKPPLEVFGGSALITAGTFNAVICAVHSDIYADRNDAEFIANAPTDIDKLLDYIAELELIIYHSTRLSDIMSNGDSEETYKSINARIGTQQLEAWQRLAHDDSEDGKS